MTASEQEIRIQGQTPPVPSVSFVLFARLWALAGVFHFLSYHDWRWTNWSGILLGAVTLCVLLRPTWQLFGFFVLMDWLLVGRTTPYHPNHILFSWVINLTILLTLAVAWKRRAQGTTIESNWYTLFAPWARLELGVLYFFAVFHKLNSAYFDPEVSCSAAMLRELATRFPILPTGPWAQNAAIYGILVAEAIIPILLAVRPTRLAGLVLGISFHGLLALHPYPGIYSFSATVMALFALFLPESFAARLEPPGWLRLSLRFLCVAGLSFLGIWAARDWLPFGQFLELRWPALAFGIGYGAALVYAGVSLVLIVWLGRRHAQELAGGAPGSLRQLPALIILPVFLVVVGLQPYLGLRTLVCFSMFSNLQTENGQSNHLLMPDSLQLTRWQRDLVEVLETSDPYLAGFQRDGVKIPFLELRRIRTGAGPDFQIRFRRGDQEFRFASSDPSTRNSIEPLGFIERRYFFFRPVEPDPRAVRCRW